MGAVFGRSAANVPNIRGGHGIFVGAWALVRHREPALCREASPCAQTAGWVPIMPGSHCAAQMS